MKVIIRKAQKKDSTAILHLIKELAVFEKEPDSVVISEKEIESYGFDANPLFQCFVAEVEGSIVGMALYYPRFSTWKGPTLHLEDLIVSEAYKGKGIGTQLYTAFIQEAFNTKVARIEWNVLDWNTPAIAFYEKSGANVLHQWSTVQMHRSDMKTYLENKKNENL